MNFLCTINAIYSDIFTINYELIKRSLFYTNQPSQIQPKFERSKIGRRPLYTSYLLKSSGTLESFVD